MGRRKTTLMKTKQVEQRLKEHEAKPKRVQQVKTAYVFTQEQLLREGIETEQANARWLYGMKMIQDEADEQAQGPKMKHQSYIRFLSRRGSYNTVTFSEVRSHMMVFNCSFLLQAARRVCLTGLIGRGRWMICQKLSVDD